MGNGAGAQRPFSRPSSTLPSAQSGDTEAMAELFRRHYSRSVGVARRILPVQEDCLDAVQSAYLSAFQNFQSFRAEASFNTWITRIVVNQCLGRLRKPDRHCIKLTLDQSAPTTVSRLSRRIR